MGWPFATCVPADPQSMGGSEATVRIVKADLVPTETNLLGAYRSFGALERDLVYLRAIGYRQVALL